MIAATGWTADTLRAQPARLVRALAWRAFVVKAWTPDLGQAARAPVDRRQFATPQEWLNAVKVRDQAASALREIEAVLWPEDDDG